MQMRAIQHHNKSLEECVWRNRHGNSQCKSQLNPVEVALVIRVQIQVEGEDVQRDEQRGVNQSALPSLVEGRPTHSAKN
jgi:hypothetical protein